MAATASYLEARCASGRWLVRIENIDPPREQPGASDSILRTLENYGFHWDGEVIYQSRSESHHNDAVAELLERGLAYPCGCSRKDLAGEPTGPLGSIYPGTCRNGTNADETAIRVRTDDDVVSFVDRYQGLVEHRLESESGDFIIRRRDGLIAYQLAVVVDDALQGITHVVRGLDLVDSTPRQVHLQRLLGLPTPDYAHFLVAQNAAGDKLSKLTGAPAVDDFPVGRTLVDALAALQQSPPDSLARESTRNIWTWALQNWRPEALHGKTHIAVQHYC